MVTTEKNLLSLARTAAGPVLCPRLRPGRVIGEAIIISIGSKMKLP